MPRKLPIDWVIQKLYREWIRILMFTMCTIFTAIKPRKCGRCMMQISFALRKWLSKSKDERNFKNWWLRWRRMEWSVVFYGVRKVASVVQPKELQDARNDLKAKYLMLRSQAWRNMEGCTTRPTFEFLFVWLDLHWWHWVYFMTFDTPCGIAKGAGFGMRINHLCISARRPSSVRTSGEDSRRHVERVKTSEALAYWDDIRIL